MSLSDELKLQAKKLRSIKKANKTTMLEKNDTQQYALNSHLIEKLNQRRKDIEDEENLEQVISKNQLMKADVASLRKKFEQTIHPYSKVGGNLADTHAINRTAIASPIVPKLTSEEPVLLNTDLESLPAKHDQQLAQISQEELDYDFAMKLQQEFDREATIAENISIDHELANKLQQEFEQYDLDYNQQSHDDHVLAAKLQIEEEINEGIDLPLSDDLHLPTLDALAASIYSNGKDQIRQQNNVARPDISSQHAKNYLSQFALMICIETCSLQMAITANGFIMYQVRQAMVIHISENQDSLNVAIETVSQVNSLATNQYGLFNYSNYSCSQHRMNQQISNVQQDYSQRMLEI